MVNKIKKFFYRLYFSIDGIGLLSNKDNLNPVSVCIPCYEMHGMGYEYLRRLLNSLCMQSYKNFEVIISDQSKTSSDVKRCADEFTGKLCIKYVTHGGSSSSSNMNNAIRNSSYALIKPLFQDDFLINSRAIYDIAKSGKKWGASKFIHTDQQEKVYFHTMIPEWNDKIITGVNTIGCPSVIYFYKNETTYFDENLIWMMDCAFYQMLYDQYGEPDILHNFHICVRLWDDSVSGHVSDEIKKKEYNYVGEKFGFKPVLNGNSISNNFSRYKKEVSISVDTIVHDDGSPYKVFLQIEPPEILPITDDILRYHKNYDLILAWNEEILNKCKNSVLFPFGTSWIKNSEVDLKVKEFKVSYLTSSKHSVAGHVFRREIYEKLPKKIGTIPVTKHRSPPMIPDKAELLNTYQYSIIIENVFRNNWFTEKLIDCFMTKTIPVYKGCPNIDKFFNAEGVYTFNNYEELEKLFLSLTSDDLALPRKRGHEVKHKER